MPTARQMITLALKEAGVIGVGQTPLAQDINDGLTYLQMMMGEWQIQRWAVPALITVNTLANGSVSNTVGVGGDFNTTWRPNQIKSAYFTQVNIGPNDVSYPLRQLFSKEDYDRIALKDLNSFPQYFFYDNDWPLGNLFVWPIASSSYRVYLTIAAFLDFPSNLNDILELPSGYQSAIHYNLAVRLAVAYQKDISVDTRRLATTTFKIVKTSNVQISSLEMPAALKRGPAFNIFNPDNY